MTGMLFKILLIASSSLVFWSAQNGAQDSPSRYVDPYFTPVRPLTVLSRDGREFIDAFNRAAFQPRLVLVLSPTSTPDQRLVSDLRSWLDRLEKPKLKIFVLWTPAEPRDSRRSAHRATALLSDSRVDHYYDTSATVARMLALRLEAWDGRKAHGRLFGYDAGRLWGDLPPPFDLQVTTEASSRQALIEALTDWLG